MKRIEALTSDFEFLSMRDFLFGTDQGGYTEVELR